MKKNKIKKYKNGLGSLKVENALSSGGALGGMALGLGIDALTQSNVDGKYTSQLEDSNQDTGRAIGSATGGALNLLVPGLGSIASPVLGSAGAAIQRGFQKNKLNKIVKDTNALEANEEFNTRIDNEDITSTQKKQFAGGSKKVKVNKPTMVAESTSTPKILKPNLVTSLKDIKDKQTRSFLESNSTSGDQVSEEQNRLALNRHVASGNPKVRTNQPKSTFTHFNNTVHLKKTEDYLDELAHSVQLKRDGAIPMTLKNGLDIGLHGKNKYITKGTVEHEAHSVIKPKLEEQATRKQAVENLKVLKKSTRYSKGTKVIEIEGKTTPEIHTDKNFNVKNLGKTPHSKGGDKVLAEEGDVVFPTQNSKTKYNEVMTAIKQGNKSKLKKIQSKLPEDKSPKYKAGGTFRASKYDDGTDMYYDDVNRKGKYGTYEEAKKTGQRFAAGEQGSKYRYATILGKDGRWYKHDEVSDNGPLESRTSSILPETKLGEVKSLPSTPQPNTEPLTDSKIQVVESADKRLRGPSNLGYNKYKKAPREVSAYERAQKEKMGIKQYSEGTGSIKGVKRTTTTADLNYDPLELKGITNKAKPKPKGVGIDPRTGRPYNSKNKNGRYGQASKAEREGEYLEPGERDSKGNINVYKNPVHSLNGTMYNAKSKLAIEPLQGRGLESNLAPVGKVDTTLRKMPDMGKPSELATKTKKGLGVDDALEMAPIAYNIGQGLFGKADKVKRNYYNPNLEQYTDTSDPLRARSNSIYNQDKTNSRNLSSGVAGNMRSNYQASANSEFDRQNQINSQETSKELGVNQRNVGIKNHAKMFNIGLDNQYNEVDAANKGAKSAMLSQGITDLGALGSRNKLQKSQLEAYKIMGKAAAGNTMYDDSFFNDGEAKIKAKKGIKKIKYKGKK